jgi:4-amino-4-deoxy-L-arabinose transferase-like glycosyltransferase
MIWLTPDKAHRFTPVGWVVLGAAALRTYSAAMRCIINPDGAQYIFQASAIFNQQWSELLGCKLNFVSPLPFLIAAAYGIFRDWIVASQAVNVFFGTATLIPLYYLLKRFADRTVCTLTLLIYALMPVFVEGSGNILRGPIFWFFSAMGMLMFVRQFDQRAEKRRFRFDLLLSSLCFIMATWGRIEGVMFLAVSPLYLLVSATNKRMQRVLIFIAPLAAFGLLAMAAANMTGNNLLTATRIQAVYTEATQFSANYDMLESQIKATYADHNDLHARFHHRVREILPLIPIVSIFHNFLSGVFYPFALIYFIGLTGLRQRYREDRRIGYFLWLSLAAFILLYIHMIQTWIISYRFLAILIYPGCLILANGIEITIQKISQLRQWPAARAAIAVTAFLILFGLPKSLKPEESDKIVYRRAADIIAAHRQSGQSAPLFAAQPRRAFEWVLLYSHRHDALLRCSMSLIVDIPSDYTTFIRNLDTVDARFFFYEEKNWPANRFALSAAPYHNDLRILDQWHHPDSGTMILFERLPKEKG